MSLSAALRAALPLEDQDVLDHMHRSFDLWVIEDEPEFFMRQVRRLHKQWILSRFGYDQEPKEKWRYLVAMWDEMLSGVRACKRQQIAEYAREEAPAEKGKPEDAEASEKKMREAIDELQAFERKVKLWQIAQKMEEGETNFKVYQGLLPGEACETLQARMVLAIERKQTEAEAGGRRHKLESLGV